MKRVYRVSFFIAHLEPQTSTLDHLIYHLFISQHHQSIMAAGAVSRFQAILRSRKLYSKLGTLLAVRVAAIGVAKRLDVSHPETLRNIRFAFVAINLLAILVFIYVISRVRRCDTALR